MKKIIPMILTSVSVTCVTPMAYADEMTQLIFQKVKSHSEPTAQPTQYTSQYSGVHMTKVGSAAKAVNIPEHQSYISTAPTQQEIYYYQNLDELVQGYVLKKKNVAKSNPNEGFIKPVNYKVNSEYGMRFHPIHKRYRMHTGVDFAAPTGMPIRAIKSGYVTFSGTKGGYGKAVILQHDKRYSSLYGHASKLLVKENEYVKQGQVIALVGSTGNSTGPHLHCEIFENGERINPRKKMSL